MSATEHHRPVSNFRTTREAEIARDLAAIRQSRQQIAAGKVHDLDTAFRILRAELLMKKAQQEAAE
jgi:hypothetical protein